MAYVVLTETYPDHKGKKALPAVLPSPYTRYSVWRPWRTIASGAPDVTPSAIVYPYTWAAHGIVDVRGNDYLSVAVTGETLTAAGLLTNITDWQGELWLAVGPPLTAQWCKRLDVITGPMADNTYVSPPIPLGTAWFAKFLITNHIGAGDLVTSLRML